MAQIKKSFDLGIRSIKVKVMYSRPNVNVITEIQLVALNLHQEPNY